MQTFTIDVSYSTHYDLQKGITQLGFRRVRVLADSGDQASLIAAQIVACHGVMPTATTHCI